MSNRFTEKAEKSLNNAQGLAEAFGHTYIGTEHVLLSLCKEKESVAATVLKKNGISYEKISSAIKDLSGVGSKSTLSSKDMTPRCRKIVENSYRISVRYGALKIGTEHILLSILEEKECIGLRILSFIGADTASIADEILTILRTAEKHFEVQKTKKELSESPLLHYGKNLTELALADKLDPVVGRDRETDRIIRILCRKTKNNPCLIGEAGVGKTAIVEGLAIRIARGDVPFQLRDKNIFSVDLTSMVAGAKYRGDFEERIKSMIQEAAKNKSVILFIDEIHTIVGAGSAEGAIDAANILKPQLSRAEIQLIGATTFKEYHKYIEKDAALERRFQALTVNEPTKSETLNILYGLKPRYETHHSVRITDEALRAAVDLSERYIQDRYFPDKAIDIIDEACAKANVESAIILSEHSKRREKTRQIEDDRLLSGERKTVDEDDVVEIITEITGIPISGLTKRIDSEILSENLKSKIYGQDDAVDSLVQAVVRSEAGINDPERPKGVFLFVGASGVGKTELAKALSEELFQDKKSLIRYDMSEFSEKNSVTILIGSPPGYVGYEEGGSLTEKIRRHPYSVILFDEIEKAHQEVLNLFLQIMEDGVLTDSCGRCVSFKNSYIIMTSNAVSASTQEKNLGFLHNNSDSKDEKLFEFFTPEFINRIDSIIHFSGLSVESLAAVAQKRLESLKSRLADLNVDFIYTDALCRYAAERALNKRLGARSVLRMITSEVENKISTLMLNGDLTSVRFDIEENKIIHTPEFKNALLPTS